MRDFASSVGEVIVSVTNRCSTFCQYCSELHNPINKTRASLSTTDFQTIMAHIIRASVKQSLRVLFFGGEPTIRGSNWIEKQILWLTSQAATEHKQLVIRMSTNGELIDQSWCDLFKKYGFTPGISYDGPDEISMPARKTSKAAERAITLLRKNGMRPGVMVVATQKNMIQPSILIDSLKELDVGHFHILYQCSFDDYGRFDEPDSETVIAASCYIIEQMLENPICPTETRLLLYMERFLSDKIQNRGIGCTSLYCPAGVHTIYVHPTGKIYPCSSFVSPGNELAVLQDGIVTQVTDSKNRYYGFLKGNSCFKCSASRICFFGCGAQKGATRFECRVTLGIYDFLERYTKNQGDRKMRKYLESKKHLVLIS